MNPKLANCNFIYETVASCDLSSFIDFFYVRWINGIKVFVIGGFMERTYESWRRLPFELCETVVDKSS